MPVDRVPHLHLRRHYGWSIERVFQQVTEVFGLERLIGSSPAASVFQFALCLVLYNLVQLLRAYVAGGAGEPVAEVSTEKLFADVKRQMAAWLEVLPPGRTAELIGACPPPALREHLARLLGGAWTERWRKAEARERPPRAHRGRRSHSSAHRILEKAREKRLKLKRKQRQ